MSFPSRLILWIDTNKDGVLHVIVEYNGRKFISVSAYHPDIENGKTISRQERESDIMCSRCFDDNKIETKTTFTVEYNNCLIVIRNVPCLDCCLCGDEVFLDEVSANIERIVNAAKVVLQEIAIIDYSKVA